MEWGSWAIGHGFDGASLWIWFREHTHIVYSDRAVSPECRELTYVLLPCFSLTALEQELKLTAGKYSVGDEVRVKCSLLQRL